MRKLCLITLMVLGSAAIAEDVSVDSKLGTTLDAVQASLTEMGYEVRKAEMEDDKIEVYFVRDGKMGEVYVSTETGAVTKLEMK